MQFVAEHIDTVPHLEALLLLYRQPLEGWTVDNVAARLYVAPQIAGTILSDLERRRLVRKRPAKPAAVFAYDPGWDETGQRLERVSVAYARHLAAIATFIHGKASRPVLEFARAFELKKD